MDSNRMTRKERFAAKQAAKRIRLEREQFDRELQEVIAIETSRTRRNAWKVASFMANKKRQ